LRRPSASANVRPASVCGTTDRPTSGLTSTSRLASQSATAVARESTGSSAACASAQSPVRL
jgi:hypothetical protein